MKKYLLDIKKKSVILLLVLAAFVFTSTCHAWAAATADTPYAPNPGVNIALGQYVYVKPSKTLHDDSKHPVSAIADGNASSFWAGKHSPEPEQIIMDLGKVCFIDRWVVYHAGAAGQEPLLNTRSFKLQAGLDDKKWADIDSVKDNKENKTDRIVQKFCARYIKIVILDDSWRIGSGARIAEIELYNDKAALYPKKGMDVCKNKTAYEVRDSGDEKPGENQFAWKGNWKRGQKGSRSIVIDLGNRYYLDSWTVKHSSTPSMITRSFRLLYSDDMENWLLMAQEKNNTKVQNSGTTVPFAARYIKLEILKGTQKDNIQANIQDLKVLFSKGYIPQPGDIGVRAIGKPGGLPTGHAGIVYIDSYKAWALEASYIILDYKNILNKKIPSKLNCSVMIDPIWSDRGYAPGNYSIYRVKNADENQCIGAQEYAYSKLGYGYNFNLFNPSDKTKYNCTSLVWDAWRSQGVDIGNGRHWLGMVTPNDFINDPDTYCIYVD